MKMIITFFLIFSITLFTNRIFSQCTTFAGNDTAVCGFTCSTHAYENPNNTYFMWTCNSCPGNYCFTAGWHGINTVTVDHQGTYNFIWTIVDQFGDTCWDDVSITFNIVPYASFTATQSVNPGDSVIVVFTGITSPSTTYNWNFGAATVLSGIGEGPYVITYPNAGTYSISLQLTDNITGCTSFAYSQNVNVYANCQANAGPDDTVCGLTAILAPVLYGNETAINWTCTNPYALIDNPLTPTPTVTVPSPGTYTFIWTVTCQPGVISSDTVNITFYDVPNPNAGLDQSVCGKYALLHADTTSGTTGYWYSIINAFYDASVWPGDTVLCPSCQYSCDVVVYSPSENTTFTYFWNEYNGQCNSHDSVNVYFGSIQPALSLVDPADTTACGRVFTGLNAQMPAYGTGYWYDTVSLTQFYPTNYSYNPDSVKIHSVAYGWHNFYWVTVNGNCRDTSDVVPVWFGGTGTVQGTISGLGGYTDFTAAVYESGSPVAKGTGTPDVTGLYSVSAPTGTYYLKVNIDNPAAHNNMASTYYSSSWQWNGASTVTIHGCDTTTANITMYTFPLATGGQCRAYGTVMYDNGGPVVNADVYLLYKPSNTPAILEKTNASGYYSLNNIPNGNYKIQVDIAGLPQVTTHHFTVNQNDTLFPNVNFIVDMINISKEYGWGIYADTNFLFGMGEPLSAKRPLHIYPVPFSNELFMESYNDGNITIEWYSQSGEMLSVEETNVNTGTNSMAIPAKLSRGVYYLKVVKGNTIYVKKLIKE